MQQTTRFALFLLVCIPLRAAIAFTAYYLANMPVRHPRIDIAMTTVTAVIGVGFLVRRHQRNTGAIADAGTLGEPAYWNGYAHGALFLVFAAVFGVGGDQLRRHAWTLLAADVLLGLGEFLVHYNLLR